MDFKEALKSLEEDGISLCAGDFIPMETLLKAKEAIEYRIAVDGFINQIKNEDKFIPIRNYYYLSKLTKEQVSSKSNEELLSLLKDLYKFTLNIITSLALDKPDENIEIIKIAMELSGKEDIIKQEILNRM